MGVHWKIQFLGGGFTRKQYIWGNCPKKGAWTVCRFNTGVDKKEWGGVFKAGGGEGWYPNSHYGYYFHRHLTNTLKDNRGRIVKNRG